MVLTAIIKYGGSSRAPVGYNEMALPDSGKVAGILVCDEFTAASHVTAVELNAVHLENVFVPSAARRRARSVNDFRLDDTGAV